MATGYIPLSIPGNFDATSPPGLSFFNSKPQVLFDAAADEIMHWTLRMPGDYASGPVLKLQYKMASATTGDVIIQAALMAVSDGDAADVDTDSYDTANSSATTTVPGTAGYLDEISITLTTADSVAAGDWVALKVNRDADNASDTAAGDLELISATLQYTTA